MCIVLQNIAKEMLHYLHQLLVAYYAHLLMAYARLLITYVQFLMIDFLETTLYVSTLGVSRLCQHKMNIIGTQKH